MGLGCLNHGNPECDCDLDEEPSAEYLDAKAADREAQKELAQYYGDED